MCEVLQTIYVGNDWDISNVSNNEYMFFGCRALVGQLGSKYSDGKGYGLDRANFTEKNGLLTFNGLIIKDKDDETNAQNLEQYNGQTLNVYYDRVLSAIDNGDGTWTSKAYSTCLPYDIDLTELRDANKIQVCQLYYVKDNKEFLFSNCIPELEAGQGYLIIVKEGSIRLSANNVKITNEVSQGQPVYVWKGEGEVQEVGTWSGTLRKLTNDECAERKVYNLDRDKYRGVRNDEEKYRVAWLTSFRSAFFAKERTRAAYDIVFKEWIAGDDDDPIVDFPTKNFDVDSDFSGYSDENTGIIHVIGNDGEDVYFDLQGRKLQSAPIKGVYISNGKKMIK